MKVFTLNYVMNLDYLLIFVSFSSIKQKMHCFMFLSLGFLYLLATNTFLSFGKELLNYCHKYLEIQFIIQFNSVTQLCQLFATPRTAAHQASLSITNSQSLPKLMSIKLVMPSNHLIFCRPLLLLQIENQDTPMTLLSLGT